MRRAEWDVFISYAQSDVLLATRLCDALTARGLRVFLDHRGVEEFTSISGTISAALANSTLMVALYSRAFPTSRACDYELNGAFIAGQREVGSRGRIVVVNPHSDFGHVEPLELRDIRSLSLPDYAGDLDALADRVARHAAEIGGVIGPLPDPSRTPWYPPPPRLGDPFPGLFRRQHWAVHSGLLPGTAAMFTGVRRGGVALVSGMRRAGTTTFAEEYALRFGAAYPGGVFWVDLGSGAQPNGATPWDTVNASYLAQVGAICRLLDIPTTGTGLVERLDRVRSAMERNGRASLWVVDGLPDGVPMDRARLLRNPHTAGSTLVVARTRRYEALGVQIDLNDPDEHDAMELLIHGNRPVGEPENEATRRIIRSLGGHRQALTAARRLRATMFHPLRGYQDLWAELGKLDHDVLEHDPSYAELAQVLRADIAGMAADQRAVLVLAAQRSPRRVDIEALGAALATAADRPLEEGKRRAARAVTELGFQTYVRAGAGTLRVHPLLARIIVRSFLQQSGPADALRQAGGPDLDRTGEPVS
ncbi:TIR domain-containing protein [Murinocardiopsis flavida]|uniref:TIR domain-containing protein n=1 Tax=Murinocardiopsis flavida TaxID=645275 RepID=A0A2P8DJA6_9ACTN|nr:toll/interleukin-1 receptor domain-containing protein [Murinocardiopsis flavida]PSK97306.1 TIR domain-containing protein [Murinocardiopsis flavida]